MSAKPSGAKRDEKTPSSSPKKDDKVTTSIIKTRTQASFLNTRQLRNKDISRKKISEFTQQLMSPMKEKSTKVSQTKNKKSPKEKKEKDKGKGKGKKTAAVSKVILDVQKEAKSKKRKIVTGAKAVMKPAKRARSPEPSLEHSPKRSLSVQELIMQCEEQSLSEEDFMAILTADSPVWWEHPPSDLYCEDAIFSSSEEERHFQEFRNCLKQNRTKSPENKPESSMSIPEVKHTDEKFLKKQSKLENLLGNIKNKLTDKETHRNKRKTQNIRRFIDKGKEDIEHNADIKIKQENEFEKIRKNKTQSESTSSSDDMFTGLQNDEILKDLENMDIPIENNDVQVVESENQTEAQSEASLESNEVNLNNEATKASDETKNSPNSASINNSTKSSDVLKIYYIDATDKKSLLKPINNKSNGSKSKFTITSIEQVSSTSTSPKSRDTIDNVSLLSNHEPDTISDTNIQIIDKKSMDQKADEKSDHEMKNSENKEKLNVKEISLDDKRKEDKSKPKTKNLNKQQLMTVYKIITNDEYRQKYIENVKSGSEASNTKEPISSLNFKTNVESLIEKGVNKTYSKLKPKNISVDESNVKNSEDILLKANNKDKEQNLKVTTNRANENNISNVNKVNVKEGKIINEENQERRNHKIMVINEVDANEINVNVNKLDRKENKTEHENKLESNEDKVTIVNKPDPNETISKNDNHCDLNENKTTNLNKLDPNENKLDNCGINADKEQSLHIASDVKSAKYCMKCSSIFETATCSYCAKKKSNDSIKAPSSKVNTV